MSRLILAANPWAATFALIMGSLFLFALALIIILNRHRRADYDSHHAGVILSQLHGFGGAEGALVVRSVDALKDPNTREDIRRVFLSDTDTSVPSVRSAGYELIRAYLSELSERAPHLSHVPARALQVSVLTFIFGALAVVPLVTWRELTRADGGGGFSLDVAGLILGGVDAVVGLFAAFPLAHELFGLGLAFGIVWVQFVWSLWVGPPLILAALALAYRRMDRRAPDTEAIPFPARKWTTHALALAALTWFVGVTLGTLAAWNPLPTQYAILFALATASASGWLIWKQFRSRALAVLSALSILGLSHEGFAFLAALAVAGFILSVWARRGIRRWTHARDAGEQTRFRLSVIHWTTVAVSILTTPLLLGYMAFALGTGRVIRVFGVILAGPAQTVLSVGILLAVLGLAALVGFASRFQDVRAGIRHAMSVQAVRAALFARAFPILATLAPALLLLGLGFGPVIVLAISLSFGIVIRLTVLAFNSLTYRYQARSVGTPDASPSASRVVINGRVVEDADGRPLYVAAVNGHRIAHRSPAALIRHILRDSASYFESGHPVRGSFARYYYSHGVQRGKVDVTQIRNELRGDIRSRFEANVRRSDGDVETIDNILYSNYPDSVVDDVVRSVLDTSRATRREDRYIWMG